MLNEIRYAERLCQRTARFYRHVQAAATFLTVLGGSAILTSTMRNVPDEVAWIGAAAFTVFGAVMIAMRPADKAAANEADAKRYAALRVRAAHLDDQQLRGAIDEARPADAPEFEALRDVAYNDVVLEVGQPAYRLPLTLPQRVLAAIA